MTLVPPIPSSALQQHLPFTVLKLIEVLVKEILIIVVIVPTVYVCSKVWKTAEEQSDDEVRTSQVPERSEGKTRLIWKWSLPFTVLKLNCNNAHNFSPFH